MNKQDSLAMLQDEIRECKSCGLCTTMPFSPVPGIGPVNASIMIVGEAPGEDESIAEEPFVGLAGRMLNRLLTSSGLKREDVYICNTVNCRPIDGKKNRAPTKVEIKACNQWLFKQIELVKPKVIFTLGKIPTTLLLKEKSTMKLGEHVGIVHRVDSFDVIPNWHPSFIMVYGREEMDKAINVFKMGLNYL